MRKLIKPALALALLLMLAACSSDSTTPSTKENQRESLNRETAAAARGFATLSKSQPVPVFDYSQERQTLIDVLGMRAHGTHGTAQAYALDGTLLWWCPTQGAPVPSTYQLTPSQQYINFAHDDTKERFPVDQGEQTGVYTGDSAATWTVCLDNSGKPFGQYEEANVRWTGGIVNNLPADKRAHVDEITYKFTEAKK